MLSYYGNAIKICPVEGKTYESATRMGTEEWKRFIDHVWKTLDRIRKTAVGRRIMNEMDASGHRCYIYSAGDLMSDPNVAAKQPKSFASDVAAMPVSFRPRHKNLPLNTLVEDKNKEKINFIKQQLNSLGELKKKADTAPELIKILEKARAKFPDPIRDLPPKLGISTQDLIEMCLGRKAIDNRTYYWICFYCYDFLTPGPGCDSSIRFQPYDKFVELQSGTSGNSDNAMPEWREFDGPLVTEKNKIRKIATVLLGHEMIHCWRMMRGRRIVSTGWEEEGMTVGLGPFLNWPVTENQLRRELGLPLRTTYGKMDANSTEMKMLGYYISNNNVNQNFLNQNLIPQSF